MEVDGMVPVKTMKSSIHAFCVRRFLDRSLMGRKIRPPAGAAF